MKYKMEITELNHEDLVNLFSGASYGNSSIDIDYDAEKYADIIKDCECYEDKIAEILLHGGEVTIVDMESEEEKDYESYGKANVNWKSTHWEELECSDYFKAEQGKWGHICYNIDYNTLLMGMNSNTKASNLAKEIFVEEQGDMLTAYNLLQYCVFNEVIYG